MLRYAIIFFITIGFIITFSVKPSESNGSPQWMTGKVASIVETGDSALISLMFPNGELMSVPAAADLVQGIKVGDVVTLQIIEGTARMVRVAESAPEPTPKPEEEKEQEKKVQWVTGELLSIERGAKTSLLSVKMWDGTVFNVAASNDVMADVKPGDSVIAKVVDGWAESVTKK